jgi:Zn-dependent oligopeptidase
MLLSLIIKSICLLSLLVASSDACTNDDGAPIPSVFQYPEFENSYLDIMQTYNESINAAELSLANILSLDPAGGNLTFDNTLGAVERFTDDFWIAGNRLYFLSQVSDNEEIRSAGIDADVNMKKWAREKVSYNLELYQLLKAFAATDEAAALTGEPRRLLDETIKGYERRGMGLSEDDRAQLVEWQDRLSELTTNISINIVDDVGLVEFTLKELTGLSEQQLDTLEYNENTTTYSVLTAIADQYVTVTTYAEYEETRLEALIGRISRAMEANGELILEVVQLRQQVASLLGFDSWADLKTADQMAGAGATAYGFINNLDERLADKFLEERALLLDTKQDFLGDPSVSDFHQQDVLFFQNIVLKDQYQVDQVEVSKYFEQDATLRGMFDIYEELFGITMTIEPDVPGGTWADDDGIQYVQISEASDGSPIGGMYLDLHPREGKWNHFGMFGLVPGGRIMDNGSLSYRAPIGAIVGNWPAPSVFGNTTVSLWRFDQVNTAFHELGHLLHAVRLIASAESSYCFLTKSHFPCSQVFTCTEFATFAGTSVPRDFVEAPSQMLERWLEDIDVVRGFAKHFETGEALPEDLLNSLIDSKNVFIGHFYKRQVSLGKSDLRIHSYESPQQIPATYQDLYAVTNLDYSQYYPAPNNTSLLASFGHLFGG